MARNMYNCSGFVSYHNTDLWGDAASVNRGTRYTLWPMSAAWLSTHLYNHYPFSGNKEFLRDALPTIHEASQFSFDFLIERNGSYVTSPSTSPEDTYRLPNNQTERTTIGPTMNTELLSALFSDFIDASEILGLTEDVKKAKAFRSKLLPIQIGKYGQVQEWREDYQETELSHCHISHI